MSAITGVYRPARREYRDWAARWLHGSPRGPIYRQLLADELRAIRQQSGTAEAMEYRRYLLWLGAYPGRISKGVV